MPRHAAIPGGCSLGNPNTGTIAPGLRRNRLAEPRRAIREQYPNQPMPAEQYAGPEQIAAQRVLEERQRGDVACAQPGEIVRVRRTECPDGKIRRNEENNR